MSKLKKIALISAIVCAVSTVAAIIIAPFALSSGIKTYNNLVKEAMDSPLSYTTEITIPGEITDLSLSEDLYTSVAVKRSKDSDTHITTFDAGFVNTFAEVTKEEKSAHIHFSRNENYLISEDNIKKAIHCSVNHNVNYGAVLYVPDTVSIHIDEENVPSFYFIDLQYQGFANAQELTQQIDHSRNQQKTDNVLRDNIQEIDQLEQEINNTRTELLSSVQTERDVSLFLSQQSYRYNELITLRMDLARRCILQQEWVLDGNSAKHNNISAITVSTEISQLIRDLTQAEQEYDVLSLKDSCAYRDKLDGVLDASSYAILHKEYADGMTAQKSEIERMTSEFRSFCYGWEKELPTSSPITIVPPLSPDAAAEVEITDKPMQ